MKWENIFMYTKVLQLFFFLLLYSGCGLAGDKYDYLWLAKTLGTWEVNDGSYGYYRVMVYRIPGETGAADDVVVDILEQNKTGKRTLKNRVTLMSPGYIGYVNDVSLIKITKNIMAIQLDIEMNGMGGIVLREVYLVSPSGAVKRVSKVEYQDVYEPLN